jgi:hypothetical protein
MRGKAGIETELLFECFWPGITPSDLLGLDERLAAAVSSTRGVDTGVSYLGALLMAQDEVVLCRFAGSELAARRAAEVAGIPFSRVVVGTRSPMSR